MTKIFKKVTPIAMVVLFAFISSPYSFAQVKEIKLGVDGLACPFCAYGLEKKLKTLEGLESLDISLKKGMAVIVFIEDNKVDLANIKTMVTDAGYTLRSMTIKASGIIQREEKYFLFNIKGNKNKLYIFDEHTQQEFKEEHPVITLNVELKKKLEDFSKDKIPVTITGSIHSHSDGSFGLSIEEYSVKENKE